MANQNAASSGEDEGANRNTGQQQTGMVSERARGSESAPTASLRGQEDLGD